MYLNLRVFESLTLNVIGNVAFGIDLSDPSGDTAKRFIEESHRLSHIEKMMSPVVLMWIFFAGKHGVSHNILYFVVVRCRVILTVSPCFIDAGTIVWRYQ